jgi:predicted metallopeptidase
MSLIEIVDQSQIKKIQEYIKQDCTEFNKLNLGSKAKAADKLYTENRILKELGTVAVDTIERMDEDIEMKDNKIKVLSKELKDINQYDEKKIQDLLNKNPVIRSNGRERVKRRLMNTLSLTK